MGLGAQRLGGYRGWCRFAALIDGDLGRRLRSCRDVPFTGRRWRRKGRLQQRHAWGRGLGTLRLGRFGCELGGFVRKRRVGLNGCVLRRGGRGCGLGCGGPRGAVAALSGIPSRRAFGRFVIAPFGQHCAVFVAPEGPRECHRELVAFRAARATRAKPLGAWTGFEGASHAARSPACRGARPGRFGPEDGCVCWRLAWHRSMNPVKAPRRRRAGSGGQTRRSAASLANRRPEPGPSS